MSILDGLNPEQRKAASKIEGPVLILAGAGSGKTRTITYRIAHMIEELGISPYSVLAVTFTNKAANEMRERVLELIGDEAKKTMISTFHSFGVRLLRKFGESIGYPRNFNIYDTEDQKTVISRIIKGMDLDKDKFSASRIASKIGKLKEESIFPEEYTDMAFSFYEKSIVKIYEEYQKTLRENIAMDFSDILIYTNEILSKPEILSKIQERYKYIMVDEYQDTNKTQYEIISKIASKEKNICVVGDEDQSIYGFRGADIRNILNFEQDYKNSFIIKLEQNYRSTNTILETANSIIKNNTTSRGKQLWTERDGGDLIKVYESESGKDEAAYVAKEIKKIINKGEYNYKDITILYRMNAQSRNFEEEFRGYNIPYKIFGGMQFYQRKEIKDILGYLNVLNNPFDNLSLLRIINVPGRGIGSKTIEKLQEYCNEQNISLLNGVKVVKDIESLSTRAKGALSKFYDIFDSILKVIHELTISEVLEMVFDKTQYLEKLQISNQEDRVSNLLELRNSIFEFQKNDDNVTLSEFLEKVSLTSTTDELEEAEDYIKLMTIHNSKGLEFPVVFMVGFEDELFPGSKVDADANELEEERRLCYVGITRAKDILFLTYATARVIYGSMSYMREPSRFLNEMPEKNIHEETIRMDNRYKKNSLKETAKLKSEINKNFEMQEMNKTGFNIGDYINHKTFGEGKIKNIFFTKDKMKVEFKGCAEKMLKSSTISKYLVENN